MSTTLGSTVQAIPTLQLFEKTVVSGMRQSVKDTFDDAVKPKDIEHDTWVQVAFIIAVVAVAAFLCTISHGLIPALILFGAMAFKLVYEYKMKYVHKDKQDDIVNNAADFKLTNKVADIENEYMKRQHQVPIDDRRYQQFLAFQRQNGDVAADQDAGRAAQRRARTFAGG